MCRNRHHRSDPNDPYAAARKKVKAKKDFYQHLMVFIFINLFVNISSFLSGDFFSSMPMTFFWGIGLAAHYISVFGPFNGRFSEDWEEREVRKEMNRMERRHNSDISQREIDEHLGLQDHGKRVDESELV